MNRILQRRVMRTTFFFGALAVVIAALVGEFGDLQWIVVVSVLVVYAFLLWSTVATPVVRYPTVTTREPRRGDLQPSLTSLASLATDAFKASKPQAYAILMERLEDIFFEKVKLTAGFTNDQMRDLIADRTQLGRLVNDPELQGLLSSELRQTSFSATLNDWRRLVEKIRRW